MSTNKIYDRKGNLAARTIHDGMWTIKQIKIADGTWWNVSMVHAKIGRHSPTLTSSHGIKFYWSETLGRYVTIPTDED